MDIRSATNINETLAKIIFLVLPTAYMAYSFLWNANAHFSILQNNALIQSGYLLLGMFVASIFYAFRFRFISTFLILIVALGLVYKGLDASAVGEFDTFFISIKFLIFGSLFALG
ncbi:MAG: hypothetical protein IT256_05420 [Chitinophagaceae bacterium]|nr:hypothetical protein [Chitinophagaceae bacterium]